MLSQCIVLQSNCEEMGLILKPLNEYLSDLSGGYVHGVAGSGFLFESA